MVVSINTLFRNLIHFSYMNKRKNKGNKTVERIHLEGKKVETHKRHFKKHKGVYVLYPV